ncbi:tail fiber assembly protein [Vibrio parahaemolyticus]
MDLFTQESIESKWREVRRIRDKLIQLTDYTQMPDSPLSTEKKAEFATYRQALRDIPQDVGNPDDVVWPSKPTI